MTRDADDARDEVVARRILQHTLEVLKAFSSRQFQESVWIRNDSPEGYVNDFVEAAAMFEQFVKSLDDCGLWKSVPLNEEQLEQLREFGKQFWTFYESVPDVYDSLAVVQNPRWPSIMSHARETLEVLESGDHGLKASVMT